MNLENRLKKLELATQETSASKPEAVRMLERCIIEIADRTEGAHLNEAWCLQAAPIEIAAMSFRELETGADSPSLWAAAVVLDQRGGIPGKLFAHALESRNAA